ncbi:MAG TPA: 1,2-phenylacetyl-CoA epoxidase subunit PaaC [Candidatus Dormibacteraeota bacterium]
MIAVAGVETYALRLGDDCLVLAQRLGEWSSRAPELEEDVALTNIALDLLGQARALLTYAGALENRGRDEDAFAYLREEREFLNCQLVEQPNGDFAQTIARQLLFSTYQVGLWEALASSADETLAAIAARAVKEATYHRDHAVLWTLRLGDGTVESRARMERGLAAMWPYSGELFEEDGLLRDLVARGIAAGPAPLREGWDAFIDGVLAEATLRRPAGTWAPTGGRSGLHTEAFGYLLAEMQHLHRSHPAAAW